MGIRPPNLMRNMLYPTIKYNVVISEESGIAIDMATGNNIELPSGAFPVLKLVDGKTDIDAIIDRIISSYKTTRECVHNFIMNMSKLGFVALSSSPCGVLREDKLPIRVASIELTDRCNLKCRYCYGAFAPEKSESLCYEDAVRLFAVLRERNVQTVELTGGEPSVNPDYDRILEEACRRFAKVTVMTNAVLLRESTLEIYKSYRDKIGFSVSIDGFSDESNDFQRGVRNTFRHTVDNIVRIKDEVDPKYFRVVYMLTNENMNEADDFFEFMLSHDIKELMVSVPENIEKGRTYKLADGCMMSDRSSESRNELEEKVDQLGDKYLSRIHSLLDNLGEKGIRVINAIPSCGAGWAMLSFQANGNVQPCNMMGPEWNLGNYKIDTNLDFLSFRNPLYAAFANINLSAENGNRAECKGCYHESFCGKCINKIFMANSERMSHGKGLCPILKRQTFLSNNRAE